MRFKETKFFSIDELLLDENNYRFGFSQSQQECINLIYNDSPQNFMNLLSDLINNNIGDYPLVYETSNNKIVYDGNRRISILKIINNPNLAPNENVKEAILKIDKSLLPFNLKKIGCFVSKNKKEIFDTVYERHAAGHGISRIQWSAYATSKFRYDQKIDDHDWRATAILLYLENVDEESQQFINSPLFFFETFKRLIRHAYNNGYLHFDIFNENKNVLNTEDHNFQLGLELGKNLLRKIKKQEVGLSRGKNYASKEFVTELFNHHYQKVTQDKPPKKTRKSPRTINADSTKRIPQIANVAFTETNKNSEFLLLGQLDVPTKIPKLNRINYDQKINQDSTMVEALNTLNVNKFIAIYKSLLKINPIEHPLLTVVGIWSFLDSLQCYLQPKSSSDFTSFFNSHLNIENKEDRKLVKSFFEFFLHEGNFNKHNATYSSLNGKDICLKFNYLQPYIAKIINEKVST